MEKIFKKVTGGRSLKIGIRFKLVVFVVGALVLLSMENLYVNYWQELDRSSEQIGNKFSVLAEVLGNDITRWCTNRENEVVSMGEEALVQEFAQEALEGSSNPDTTRQLQDYWKKVQNQFGIYDEIFFSDRTGRILASTDTSRTNTYRKADQLISEPLQTGSVYFSGAYLSTSTGKPCIALSVPVRGRSAGKESGAFAGVLVYRIDIQSVIQPLLESSIDLGSTGDIVLFDDQRIAINELRTRPGSALTHQLQGEPAQRAVLGEKGVMRTTVNGKEVIAAYSYIPKPRWGLIIRQETDELFGPVRYSVFRALVINMAGIALILGLLFYLLNRMIKPVAEMEEVAREIARGNFSRRIHIERSDEIGRLGNTINYMAGEMERQYKLQKNTNEFLEVLVSALEMHKLLDDGLAAVCRNFDFKLGSILLADADKEGFVVEALYCPGRLLKDCNRIIRQGEGIEGLAAITGEVQVLTGLPEDSVYMLDWLGGSIVPASIVTVPIVFGAEVLGVMTLASLNKIESSEAYELQTLGAMFGVAINNSMSYKRTVDLSVRLKEANEQLAQQNEELSAQSEELMTQSEELQAQAEQMQAQSEDLQETSSQLRAKNIELERLTEQKTIFLAGLSHELRAPLNAVISFSDVLLDRVVGELTPQQDKYLHEIHKSGQHLLNLINDLLDISRLEIGKVELDLRPWDPFNTLEEALGMVSADISGKRLEVINSIKPGTYTVLADQGRLKQIFLNLLTNAVKFTPEGGRITLGAESKDNAVSLWVADTGKGISPEYHDVIFEEFKQVGGLGTGGTGLGLAVTKKLIEQHGGKISVESEEGRGAIFTFTLPLHAENSPGKCPIRCDQHESCAGCSCHRLKIGYLPKPLDKNILLECVGIECSVLDKTPLILVIDDDLSVRNYVADILRHRGYSVISAEDGEKGLQLALGNNPDIIILDIIMPGKDGFQVMEELGKHCWERGLSVFICTSKDLSPEERQMLESGFKKALSRKKI